MAELKRALDAEDWDSLRRISHSTKGVIGTMATPKLLELFDALQYLEEPLNGPRVPRELAEELGVEMKAAIATLRAQLGMD